MAKDKKPPKTVIIPAPIWLLSFGDTVALMLAFFVMLFAMSSVEESNVSKLIAAVTSEAPRELLTRPVPNSNLSVEHVKIYNGLSLDYIYQLLEDKIRAVDNLSSIQIMKQAKSVVISLPSEIFVSYTSPVLTEKAREMIFDLGLILAPFSNVIQVEGHKPPQTLLPDQSFSNRWEMMLLRSGAVAQEIRRSGLLASTKVLGWSPEVHENHEQNGRNDDHRVNLRITKIAGGQ